MDDLVAIENEDRLLRRIPYLDPNFVKDDGSLSSPAFQKKKNEDGLSVDLEKLTTYEKSIVDKHRYRLYCLMAQIPRDNGLDCKHDPQQDNYAHALIVGEITKPLSRKLAAEAKRIKFPD